MFKFKFLLVLLIGLLPGAVGMTMTELYDEPFRPQYHYSPPQAWMNDPNGLVYFEGEYHLFYQHHPDGLTWGPMHWGHAVSPDLIHWETLPIALYPDDLGTIFSGSVVVDKNNTAGFGENALVAMYSYNTQTQGIAYSTDRGRTWTKYEGNPVIGALAHDFRDPKVSWHEPTQQWVMILAAGREAQIFTSPNLLEWTFASRFAAGHVVATWECPDLFPLEIDGETKWVLLVSVAAHAPAGGSGMQYFIGDFDGKTFTNDNPPGTTLWVDYGPDNYAAITWHNTPDDRRIYIGWMNNWVYANTIPTSTWRGATTLPREVRLVRTADGLRLAQAPVEAVEQLRVPLGAWEDVVIEGDYPLEGVNGRTLEILADIRVEDSNRFGLEFHRDAEHKTRVLYNADRGQLLISRLDTTEAGTISGFNPAFGAPLALEDNRLRLRIFVDESSVEVFTEDGLTALTAQTFVDPSADGVALFADNGSITVERLEIYALRSIWE